MLPAIKENDSASFVVFNKKSRNNRVWRSRGKAYLDLLKRKARQIQGPKIKFPECLVKYYEKKRVGVGISSNFSVGFPDVNKMMDKIRSLTSSPVKRDGGVNESLSGKKFKF